MGSVDAGYPNRKKSHAMCLVVRALDRATAKVSDTSECYDYFAEQTHVTPQQLCCSILELAFIEWGLMALCVLHCMGMDSSEGVARVVGQLVACGDMSLNTGETLADFANAFDFVASFEGAAQRYRFDFEHR